ncbi:MAG: YggT family protein [Proteobacteria bacterium]|nr:YggT family protein [Pseudomonadota bacterium]
MYIIGNLLDAVAVVFGMALQLYMWLIIARAVLSWVNPDPYNPIVQFLYRVTEPVLYWVRKRVPLVAGGIDLSPLIVIFAIFFLQSFLVKTLRQLASQLQ